MVQEHKTESPTLFGKRAEFVALMWHSKDKEQSSFFMHTQDTEQTYARDSSAQDVSREAWVKGGSRKVGAEEDLPKSACITAAL